jgi:methyl-accepting chemotaxis protein
MTVSNASSTGRTDRAGVGRTEAAVEETASLMADINSSIRGINREVESLSTVTEEASSSILEMGSSIDEVARSVGQLHGSVDSSTASIHQISASMRQISESADAVEAMAEESAAAITQMDRAIQQVGEHVREAAVLTDRVSQEAEDGSSAVSATIDGIETIRSLTRDARDVLEKLAERIGEIGEILTVIGGINEETNLLSLNAAIIAAQAGEQGKAFAVVANHVKTLAQHDQGRHQEIGRLINAVQDESRNAVQAMAADPGRRNRRRALAPRRFARSRDPRLGARGERARRRICARHRADAQLRRTSPRRRSDVRDGAADVGALGEQRRAGENLLRNAEAALELCRQVHRSTEEQRTSGRFVRDNIASITEMIRFRRTRRPGQPAPGFDDGVAHPRREPQDDAAPAGAAGAGRELRREAAGCGDAALRTALLAIPLAQALVRHADRRTDPQRRAERGGQDLELFGEEGPDRAHLLADRTEREVSPAATASRRDDCLRRGPNAIHTIPRAT